MATATLPQPETAPESAKSQLQQAIHESVEKLVSQLNAGNADNRCRGSARYGIAGPGLEVRSGGKPRVAECGPGAGSAVILLIK